MLNSYTSFPGSRREYSVAALSPWNLLKWLQRLLFIVSVNKKTKCVKYLSTFLKSWKKRVVHFCWNKPMEFYRMINPNNCFDKDIMHASQCFQNSTLMNLLSIAGLKLNIWRHNGTCIKMITTIVKIPHAKCWKLACMLTYILLEGRLKKYLVDHKTINVD